MPPLEPSTIRRRVSIASAMRWALVACALVARRADGADHAHPSEPWSPPAAAQPLFAPPVESWSSEPSGAARQSSEDCHTYSSSDFSPDPFFDHWLYDPLVESGVYGDKYLNPVQRPLVEWGMPFYDTGPLPAPSLDFGPTNPSQPRFYLYGDYRAAAAFNTQNGGDVGVLANRLNLEWDLWFTSTERLHMFTGPFQEGNNFAGFALDRGDFTYNNQLDFFDPTTDALFFEGDLGYMVGGWSGRYASVDLPIAVGLIPLFFQNGIWMEDTILGVAASIPARNSPWLDWSNYDVTFFAGFDQVTSPAFANSNAAASLFGATTFIDVRGGYVEAGYAFLHDTAGFGRSYHNVGLSYTRRYFNRVSNSMRVIWNLGQGGAASSRTADGVLLIAENAFLTPWPYNVVPYVNLFAGFDNPQSVARAGTSGGILRNTGILFESDALTGFPTLNASGSGVYGAAFGLNLLAPTFANQLILEAAVLQAQDGSIAGAGGNQFGLGALYQFPISHRHLLRFGLMRGWLRGTDDVSGARAEFRWKF